MDIRGVVLDLDGTVYNGQEEVPGAARFIQRLNEKNIGYIFVTNRANRTPEQIADQLHGLGIPCSETHIITSAQVTAAYLKKGTAFIIGEQGLRKALEQQGLTITDRSPDYVVVSFDTALTYQKLETACRLINQGARFVSTNPDKRLKTEHGLIPGTGAIVAAVSTATGVEPFVVGKPGPLIVQTAVSRLGLRPEEVIVVGDNVETDIPAGIRAGLRTALILQGVSSPSDLEQSAFKPTWVVRGYEELWAIVASGG